MCIDVFNIRQQNDNVHDFDVRWDQALLSASETPTDMCQEGLYKSKLQDSVQLQIVLVLYDEETVTERRKIEIKSRRQILQKHMAQYNKSGKEGSIQRDHSEARAS